MATHSLTPRAFGADRKRASGYVQVAVAVKVHGQVHVYVNVNVNVF